ncbi:MAG: leucyl aminopeptidase [Bacilli bacterium]|nr:leucyl aminopeptidase [Bacilli bacterium]
MFEIYQDFEEIVSEKPLLIGLFEKQEKIEINEKINKEVEELIKDGIIKTGLGEVNKLPTFSKIKNKIVYIIGLGKKEEYTINKFKQAVKNINYKLGSELVILLDTFKGALGIKEVAFNLIMTSHYFNYKYDEFLSKKIDNDLLLKICTKEDIKEEIEEALNIAVAIDNTRDLVNRPYNYLSAIGLAEYASELVSSLDSDRVKIAIYNKKEIEELKMNAFLGVNKGSTCEPRLIYIKYQGLEEWKNPVALVGKGIMYDTGGYSIKTSMNTMKDDMAGAATVLGVMESLVKNKVKANVMVIICATDNRINGEALLPDDILTAMNGKTIEIVSTDAEGRLTLADAVCFAQKEGSKEIIDIATLTGACVVALGEYTTGLFGNDQNKVTEFLKAADETEESTWQLPITEHIREQVRSSKVADFTNSTGRPMGASGAAAFIEGFIEEKTKWLHLDIAGTAYHTSPSYKEFYGATGVMVHTIYRYLK